MPLKKVKETPNVKNTVFCFNREGKKKIKFLYDMELW